MDSEFKTDFFLVSKHQQLAVFSKTAVVEFCLLHFWSPPPPAKEYLVLFLINWFIYVMKNGEDQPSHM